MDGSKSEITYAELRKLAVAKLVDAGLSGEDATTVAECLLDADVCGVSTHGIGMVEPHIKKILAGQYNIDAVPEVVAKTHSFARVDARNTIGMLSATACMRMALSNAREEGVFTVFCENANTYSAAFVYATMGLSEGQIGITFCNTPPQMAPYGGRAKLLGSNPVSIAIPSRTQGSIVIDMATTVVSKSRITQMYRAGEDLPAGWAIDAEGNETTDSAKAMDGSVMPFGGHKGSGLAMAFDVLAGVISGAGYLTHVNRFYDDKNKGMNVGQTFVSIDPKLVLGESFYERMDDFIQTLRTSPTRPGLSAMFLPGDDRVLPQDKDNVTIAVSDSTLAFLRS